MLILNNQIINKIISSLITRLGVITITNIRRVFLVIHISRHVCAVIQLVTLYWLVYSKYSRKGYPIITMNHYIYIDRSGYKYHLFLLSAVWSRYLLHKTKKSFNSFNSERKAYSKHGHRKSGIRTKRFSEIAPGVSGRIIENNCSHHKSLVSELLPFNLK